MSAFADRLAALSASGSSASRRWIFVPYDQLSDGIGPLSRQPPRELGIVVVESPWKAAQRPYHKQKLALVLANLRHFALEQAARGVAVRHVVASGSYATALAPLCRALGRLAVMRPAERELREDLRALGHQLEELPHEGWLTSPATFERSRQGRTFRMESFYRRARRETGLLMHGDKPEGGKLSFDVENRKPWPGAPPAPAAPTFARDEIKEEVGALVAERFAAHPGTLDLDALPATQADAEALWSRALAECLPHFGPYEDAMSSRSATLFHSCVSALLNLHRLLPRRLVDDVARSPVPLASREGFIRQILGWREFVHHVHEATDGFRGRPDTAAMAAPGDGGYRGWAQRPWPTPSAPAAGGATPSRLDAHEPLPQAYWGARSGLHCLDEVVRDVWARGYSHHITRLMVLSNIATLLGCSPRQLTDWFWVAYADAYDWVVEPNVLAMGTFAVGDLMTTKPYVSGAAYINRMSDFCAGCQFDPRTSCPITPLYWSFLGRNEAALADNPRLFLPLGSLRRRTAEQRRHDDAVLDDTRRTLARGEPLRVAARPKGSSRPRSK